MYQGHVEPDILYTRSKRDILMENIFKRLTDTALTYMIYPILPGMSTNYKLQKTLNGILIRLSMVFNECKIRTVLLFIGKMLFISNKTSF